MAASKAPAFMEMKLRAVKGRLSWRKRKAKRKKEKKKKKKKGRLEQQEKRRTKQQQEEEENIQVLLLVRQKTVSVTDSIELVTES
jgi:hypothetical protein